MGNGIDPKLLPKRALLDTMVLSRVLGNEAEEDAGASRAFFDAMLASGKTILVATPSLAEHLRRPGAPDVPHVRGIEVVAFDRAAVKVVAEKLPIDAVKALATAGTGERLCLKVDSMVVACAVRHRADVVLTTDKGVRKLCERCGMKCAEPNNYFEKQTRLF